METSKALHNGSIAIYRALVDSDSSETLQLLLSCRIHLCLDVYIPVFKDFLQNVTWGKGIPSCLDTGSCSYWCRRFVTRQRVSAAN